MSALPLRSANAPAFRMLAEIEQSLLQDKRRRSIIQDVLPVGPSLIYGPSGAGKTGLAIRTAVAIAGGLCWADKPVSAGSVVYVAGEDIEGVKLRLVAAARELGPQTVFLAAAVMEAPTDGLGSNSAGSTIVDAATTLANRPSSGIRHHVDPLRPASARRAKTMQRGV